jgi:DNA-binding MarR family transcriptional regulator
MTFMNYHSIMKKRNDIKAGGAGRAAHFGIVTTDKSGRYSSAQFQQTGASSGASRGVNASALTTLQGEILVLLMHRKGPMRLGEIAREASLTAISTVSTVMGLETAGLVEKRRALDDGRALAVHLTETGREAAMRVAQRPDFVSKGAGTPREDEPPAPQRSPLHSKTDSRAKIVIRLRNARIAANNGVTKIKFAPGQFTVVRTNPKSKSVASPVSDTQALAAEVAQRLGVGSFRVIAHLKTVFDAVSTGNIPGQPIDAGTVASTNPRVDLADPLAAARARGRRFAREEYENPDNLALLDARDYAARNERTINEQRQKGELYALLPPGKARGFRYPKWQFDAEPERLRAVLHKFVEAGANAWVIHSFMQRKRDELGGKSPSEVILDETASVGAAVDLAATDIIGEQGAS